MVNINETCSVSEEQPIWAAQRNTTPTIKPGAQPRCAKINHCSSICKDNQWLILHQPIWNFENNAQVDKNGDHVENAGVFIKIQSTWKSKYETNIQPWSKYLKKAVSSVYVKGPQQTLMKQKTGFWYVKLSLFVLNSYHRTVGSILLSPFLFHFTLTTGQGGQDDLFLFNPLSLLSCRFLRTVGL